MTPARKRFLEYMADKPYVSAFPIEFARSTRKRAEDDGLIERFGSDPGVFGFVRLRITEKGKQELASSKAKTP